jgi:type IV pilus assembly protein PilP
MKSNFRGLLMIVVLSLPLVGCGKSNPYQDLEDYLKTVKDEQAVIMNNLHSLDVKPPAPVIYDGNLHRSPFEELNQVASGPAKGSATNPLQAYSLTMLRLLGTVTEKGVTFAYVTTPDNMVYRVQVGEMIGDHHGKVVDIQPGAVNVMELDSDNPKDGMQRVVSLKLRSDN